MRTPKTLEPLKKYAEKLNKCANNLPSISKKISTIASNLAGYTVVNGLIFFIAIKASCKRPEFQNFFVPASSFLIVLLFFFFINDVFTNYFPMKPTKNKKLTLSTILIYIIIIFCSVFITWLYVASIYQPLFTIPNDIRECKL
ncbi:TPA: hypothetical protein RG697_001316 [Morganella morganii]|uniref:hypothetical protein n=1 Tax=Morganella morganii TaxID=582 RepID=UPI001BDB3040|nr:hypothetical protein [Morganella morganii]EME8469657.1 hypothetical protein [Morganella morganii]MBT0380765.1 hypothetical protein [Morganella morganii subsp. morganii]HDU8547748.1 hypothetical protein [Morganella morganii]HDU8609727.1 hypothetical protein [Morganella morganii]